MVEKKIIRPFGTHEGPDLEFKEAAESLPKSFFETVCAFLNLDGGLIILGVADDGTVTGVARDSVDRMKTEIANLSNNPSKLDPPYLLFPHEEEIDGKWVIKVQNPTATSPSACRRSSDVASSMTGDFSRSESQRVGLH